MLIVCSLALFILYLLRMQILCEFCTKMVFCFSFIANCAKPDAPIKGPTYVFNKHDIGTYRPVWMRSGFLLTGCCLDDKQSPIFYKYKLSQKALSTLNIYKIGIRLLSQVLRKKDSRCVADRQTCNQFFFAQAQIPWNSGQTRSPPQLPGWSKVTTT